MVAKELVEVELVMVALLETKLLAAALLIVKFEMVVEPKVEEDVV